MKRMGRGGVAAFFAAAAVIGAASAGWAAGPQLAPGEQVRASGLTTLILPAAGPGSAAIEVWVRCPSDGWTSTQPGIGELAADSVMASGAQGKSVRDLARAAGGEVSVSVTETATEFEILAPAAAVPDLATALLKAVFGATVDESGYETAKTIVAEEQIGAASSSAELLRQAAFSSLFGSGPMHDPPSGTADALKNSILGAVRAYATQSYIPGSSIAVIVGDVDASAVSARLDAVSASTSGATPMLPSPAAAAAAQPIRLAPAQADLPGVALAWTGPPISDERAATAMDFLSDYLADPDAGVLAAAADQQNANVNFQGQFVTLQNAGLFFVSADGDGVSPEVMAATLRGSIAQVAQHALPNDEFARAIGAYETRLLRQMDSPLGIADNFGWYFAQGAPAYSPSATDAGLGGEYFAAASSLTPEYVREIAQRYLAAPPSTVYVVPNPVKINVSSEGRRP